MERYACALKYAPKEDGVYSLEDATPLKQQRTCHDDIVFRARDSMGVEAPTLDPMVITVGIGPATVKRVLIDCGSSCNILLRKTFDQMKILMSNVQASSQRIVGFTGEPKQSIGTIELMVELGEGMRKVVQKQMFVIVDEVSAYNAFLGRPTLAAFKIILAPWCLTMKFPTECGVGVVKGDQSAGRECYFVEVKEVKKKENGKDAVAPLRIKEPSLYQLQGEPCTGEDCDVHKEMNPKKSSVGKTRVVPVEVTVRISVDLKDPSKVLNVGSQLDAKIREALISFLKANLDFFAWSHADICGISPDIAVHTLNIDPKFTPVKQKRRTQGPERSAALREEVDRLMDNGFIKESTYPN